MRERLIECAGTGIRVEKITEISFGVTAAELEMLAKKLRALQIGDSTTVFTAEGTFEDKPVRFIVKLKQ